MSDMISRTITDYITKDEASIVTTMTSVAIAGFARDVMLCKEQTGKLPDWFNYGKMTLKDAAPTEDEIYRVMKWLSAHMCFMGLDEFFVDYTGSYSNDGVYLSSSPSNAKIQMMQSVATPFIDALNTFVDFAKNGRKSEEPEFSAMTMHYPNYTSDYSKVHFHIDHVDEDDYRRDHPAPVYCKVRIGEPAPAEPAPAEPAPAEPVPTPMNPVPVPRKPETENQAPAEHAGHKWTPSRYHRIIKKYFIWEDEMWWKRSKDRKFRMQYSSFKFKDGSTKNRWQIFVNGKWELYEKAASEGEFPPIRRCGWEWYCASKPKSSNICVTGEAQANHPQ